MLSPNESPEDFVNRIMAALEPDDGLLPVEAIREIQEHPELFLERLSQCIEESTQQHLAGEAVDGNAHIIAFFLLTEFRDHSAWPAIREAIMLPGEGPEDLYVDAVTEDLHRVLAVFAAEQTTRLDDLISHRQVNLYVRDAAISAFLLLVRDEKLTREEVAPRLLGHLRQAIAEPDEPYLLNNLMWSLSRLGTQLGLEEARYAFAHELTDESLTDLESIEENYQRGDESFHEALDECDATGFFDTVEELEEWVCFSGEQEESPWDRPRDKDFVPDPMFRAVYEIVRDHFDSIALGETPMRSQPLPNLEFAPEESYVPVETIRNTTRKVGRNESCPCGSGKKYKKCCGG